MLERLLPSLLLGVRALTLPFLPQLRRQLLLLWLLVPGMHVLPQHLHHGCRTLSTASGARACALVKGQLDITLYTCHSLLLLLLFNYLLCTAWQLLLLLFAYLFLPLLLVLFCQPCP
jgi:hypothetical protein